MRHDSDRLRRDQMLSRILEPYKLIYDHRRILQATVRSTIRARYAGSVLGMGWVLFGPLVLLALYALIYAVVFRIRPTGLELADYIVYIFSGLIPLITFGQSLGAGTNSLAADAVLLQNKVFPAELIPLREVLASQAAVFVGLGLVLCYRLLTNGPALAWLLLPVIYLSYLLTTIAVVWAFALLNLIVKDVQQVVTYIMIILLISSPIAYTPHMIPEQFKIMLYLNPLAYYVMSLQSLVVLGQVPPLSILVGCILIGLGSFYFMYRVFVRGKNSFLDLV
jgi:lipopolysaccharide transport system permease protein